MKTIIFILLFAIVGCEGAYNTQGQMTDKLVNSKTNDRPISQEIMFTIKGYEQAIKYDEGLKFALNAGYDYTILSFAVYWCSPCREIDHMFDRYKDSHPEASFNMHVSEINMHPELSELFKVDRLPNVFLLTRKGKLFEVYNNFNQILPEPFFEIYLDYWLLNISLDSDIVTNDPRLNDYE